MWVYIASWVGLRLQRRCQQAQGGWAWASIGTARDSFPVSPVINNSSAPGTAPGEGSTLERLQQAPDTVEKGSVLSSIQSAAALCEAIEAHTACLKDYHSNSFCRARGRQHLKSGKQVSSFFFWHARIGEKVVTRHHCFGLLWQWGRGVTFHRGKGWLWPSHRYFQEEVVMGTLGVTHP